MHLIEKAISLLHTAHLPFQFWFYAVSHATFLINRMTTAVLQFKSPFFSLHKVEPLIQSLKIFGTSCYPLLRPYNTNKLQSRSTECVFLGYATG